MKLYSGPVSMFSVKVLIAAAEKGIRLDVENVPYQPRTFTYVGHPEVDRINPKRQVPVLIDQGLEIFDSTLICEYLEDVFPEPPLWPAEPRSRAAARLVELKADEVWFPKLRQLGQFVRDPSSAEAAEAKALALEAYREMDETLGERTWMAGVFSLADIAAYAAFLTAYFFGLRPGDLPRLAAWQTRMESRPSVRAARDGILSYLAEQRIRLPEPA
ncbi:glutathione S-transferase family protein [Phenylobacterium sp.]|uniref:glutathione S-transferase family protein n=1 Tax=Phenylobacterium sp. TaxID=1871053 RepID=UPI002E3498A2|nr:glutathione S-transferase family protein [Phenylobacterium sp.]HEX2559658.1 glutathione S-transferase family protein [Phenylobacterium sp.]